MNFAVNTLYLMKESEKWTKKMQIWNENMETAFLIFAMNLNKKKSYYILCAVHMKFSTQLWLHIQPSAFCLWNEYKYGKRIIFQKQQQISGERVRPTTWKRRNYWTSQNATRD